ncbi:MAG: peptide chain release factor 1 [Firmicutes bacterium ML8_F2]|jgi:peptide chain release factor 1|nr:MAG: peptide chain release factor 1 [Firmicutes bacterium ML8_F2]
MLDKLNMLEKRYTELETLLSDPRSMEQRDEWLRMTKEMAALTPIIELFRRLKEIERELDEANEVLQESEDPEMIDYLNGEIESLTEEKESVEGELKEQLLPKDPYDEKSVFIEIRAGTGGEEAALFAADLLKMYARYAERKNYKAEIVDAHPTDIGGYKEVILGIEGKGVYSRMKFESGVHRVQRIPTTESGGRIHTSAATVAVLPEVEEIEVEINSQDLRIDTFCSTGPGGQSVNTTQSAVRITHVPSGIVISCQDEKSQLHNKEKALQILRSRLLDKSISEQNAELAQTRKTMVGTGDRSERIRTYNFPQNRVTDHRIGLTLHKLDMVLAGDLDAIIKELSANERAEQLKNVED